MDISPLTKAVNRGRVFDLVESPHILSTNVETNQSLYLKANVDRTLNVRCGGR